MTCLALQSKGKGMSTTKQIVYLFSAIKSSHSALSNTFLNWVGGVDYVYISSGYGAT